MMQIKLSQGHVALVDDIDYAYLNQWKWHIEKMGGTMYARRNITTKVGQRPIKMHRVILDIKDSKVLCDHINGNGLDNRRENLRICSHSENMRNKSRKTGCSSKYKGVSFCAKNSEAHKWKAHIRVNNKLINLSSFSTEEEAAKAYDNAAKSYFGEFANLNFK